MNENNDNKKQPEVPKSTWSPLAIVALLLFTLSESGDTAMVTLLFTALIVGAMVFALYKGVSAFKRRRRGGEAEAEAAPSTPSYLRDRDFSAPEAHCVVCENSGEDHFERDREARLQQLDEWLQSGLIDKAEYNELRERYERQT